MSEISIGTSIKKSVELIENVGREVESLFQMIQHEINNAIEEHAVVKSIDDWEYDWRSDDNDWVVKDYACYLGIGGRKDKTVPKRYICLQVSLAGDGMSTKEDNNQEPLLHVMFWDGYVVFTDEYYMVPSWDDEGLKLQDEVLFNWNPEAEPWVDQEWGYSLLLTSINDLDDIRKKIVNPIFALIQGQGVEGAKLVDIEGIVRYEPSQDYGFRVKMRQCEPES
ncbi:hypothetical protein Selin_0399 [Desulfurispirillum indicum S5]|uniref:Uncharacterized protein n=1 Tax=Desulfurispirillum indicum (strain ATCC BAA-1389 / DSM 22839 / S5) TaxID=653733 RepID=E6W027_DESIS|nr:hypothetical protein [Desulfurispirillum indicum]ADU65153.1 hypothetical protein Selin_0399 [Desulfurispirillum indicum S5]